MADGICREKVYKLTCLLIVTIRRWNGMAEINWYEHITNRKCMEFDVYRACTYSPRVCRTEYSGLSVFATLELR